MIAERPNSAVVSGNMTGQSYHAGVDDEDMPHLIALFTDLYSDREMAVIREYSTNAYDAQVEAGVDRPIEVTLPAPLAPFFKVKDYGVGLCAEDIQRIYSRYGRSTKRGSNDQNGMLGLGCKAALTYTDQFTVESIKDGVRTVCSISRDGQSVPVFTVVASIPDNGPNGTEVIVPVRSFDHPTFAEKAARFYSYWKPGTVLLNGQEPDQVEGLKLTDDLTVVKHTGYSYNNRDSTVVMGNVAYPVKAVEFDTGLPSEYSLIARVPIGSVNFTPSRESLDYNSVTRATLESIKPLLKSAIEAAVQDAVNQAATARGAIQAMIQWRGLLSRHENYSFQFQGRPMPDKVAGNFILVNKSSRKLGAHDRAYNGFLTEYAANALFVTGYTPTAFTAQHKRKLLQYAEDKNLTPDYFALTPAETVDMTWIEASQVVSWDDVKVIKLDTTGGGSQWWRNGRPTGSYDAYIGGTVQHVQAEDIDQDEPIYYCRAMNRYESAQYAYIIGQHFPAATVVCLPENRYAKFMRNFPEAQRFGVGLQAAYDAWKKSLTKGALTGLLISDNGSTTYLEALDPRRVDDPALRRDIWAWRNCRAAAEMAKQGRAEFRKVLHRIELGTDDYDNPCDPYKLLCQLTSYDISHAGDEIYTYLNAAYAARKEA